VLGGQASFGVTALGNYARPVVALRVSNVVLVALPFVAGFYWARSIGGNGWYTGLAMMLSGVLLVGIAIAFGG
jgi:hypothetical protein